MKEDFLHHLWKYRNLTSQIQFSSKGQRIEIIHPGWHNRDAGPDFFNARIRIDGLEWAGNVELHVKSSDWVTHGHSSDRAYDSVILHVVYEDDQPEKLRDVHFPTLALKGCVDVSVMDKYEALKRNESFVPCASAISGILDNKALISSYMERLFVEKLEFKVALITKLLKVNNGDWNETYYQWLARSFGLGKNRLPFELLARSVPLSILEKEGYKLEQLEALFFGQAGFLFDKAEDPYTAQLQGRYRSLRCKYELEPLDAHLWKFSRLRPGNFPTLRIAQFAALVHAKSAGLQQVVEMENINVLYQCFKLKAANYWSTHSKFGRAASHRPIKLGQQSVDSILINAVLPILFAYGRKVDRLDLEERAISLMGAIKTESNTILSSWKELGLSTGSAMESQALIHLKKEYCDHKKCLSCAIGAAILK
ncbi:MAG: DUF2851 family protein [Flavobacteriales bacterium]|nr:DUF2851 family protein [Flavobacteriales bacterium]